MLECQDVEALKALERSYLGKQGVVAGLLAEIPTLAPEARPAAGKAANVLQQGIAAAVRDRLQALQGAEIEAERQGAGFDPTLPGLRR